MNSTPIIIFENVSKYFGTQCVLDHVHLQFQEGKTTVIAGGSGQGKSVSLKLILGLVKPDSGRIIVSGRDITAMREWELSEIRRDFGVLFQGSALLDSLTVFENVALPLQERSNLSSQSIREKVMDTLTQFDLDGHENKYPAQLSGGMRKRVGLARALQLQPKIMLFDEPTTGLDPEKSMEIYQLFFHIQQKFRFTSIIVSHDIPKIFNLADEVFIIDQGKFSVFTNPDDIQRSDSPVIQRFVTSVMGPVYLSKEAEHSGKPL